MCSVLSRARNTANTRVCSVTNCYNVGAHAATTQVKTPSTCTLPSPCLQTAPAQGAPCPRFHAGCFLVCLYGIFLKFKCFLLLFGGCTVLLFSLGFSLASTSLFLAPLFSPRVQSCAPPWENEVCFQTFSVAPRVPVTVTATASSLLP